MQNLTLFDDVTKPELLDPAKAIGYEVEKKKHREKAAMAPWSPEGLRRYQVEAIHNVEQDIRAGLKHLLVVSATGTGKSIMMAKMAERFYKMWGHGILIIAHRRNLILQLRKNFPPLGISPCMEMGKHRGVEDYGIRSKVVIGTVQSMSGDRLEQWADANFKIIFIDEAHRSINDSYYDICNLFPNAIVIGFTATAIGAKKKGKARNLGRFYQKVSFEYPLIQAVEDNVLCRIRTMTLKTDPPIDLSQLTPKSNGEYSDEEMDEVIQNHLGSVVLALQQQKALWHPDGTPMKTIAFAPWVRSAKAISDALNDVGISANWICGDKELCPNAEDIMEAHKRGEFQVLVNRDMLIEGYDDPSVQAILMLRAVMSPVYYWQMVGRATRPYPSMENNLKGFCRVIDLAFVADKHRPIKATTLRDDSKDEQEEDKAIAEIAGEIAEENAARGEETDVLEAAEKARSIFVEREKIKIRQRQVRARVMEFDPLAAREVMGLKPLVRDTGFGNGRPATDKQIKVLQQNGIDTSHGVLFDEAKSIIDAVFTARKYNLATLKQRRFMMNLGMEPGQARRMTFNQAKEWLDQHAPKR